MPSGSTADFLERRWPRRELEGSDFDRIMQEATATLRERGATFFRVSVREMTKEIIVEGWRTMPDPDKQGDLPL
jgi:trans-aconitate methyltransferase